MKRFLKRLLEFIIVISLYIAGYISLRYYTDGSIYNVSTWIAALIAYIIIILPVIRYWEGKVKKWFNHE
jgi:hypothetical protein